MVMPFSRVRIAAASVLLAFILVPGPVFAQAIGGRVTGTVIDSTRNQPLAGAEVVLSGTSLFAVTNNDGRFFIPDVPAGSYTITFHHARIDSLGIPWPSRPLELAAGAGADLLLFIPASAITAAPAASADRTNAAARAVAPAAAGSSATTGGSTALVGAVTDAGTGRPIAGAMLQLRGTTMRNVTDDRGRFVLWGVPPGQHTLDVEMLGYAKRSGNVNAEAGRTTELAVQLSTQPIELDPITVEVRSDWLERSGFYERIETGQQANFLQRAEIENRMMVSFPDLFQAIPAVRVEYREPGHSIITLRRVVGSSAGLGCSPFLYLDGMRITGDWNDIVPTVVEAMEVYVGSNAPIGYGNSCGAILIWTRRGS